MFEAPTKFNIMRIQRSKIFIYEYCIPQRKQAYLDINAKIK